VPDFANPCCKKPKCDIPSQTGSHSGSGQPTANSVTPSPNPLLPPTLPPHQRKSTTCTFSHYTPLTVKNVMSYIAINFGYRSFGMNKNSKRNMFFLGWYTVI